MNKQIVRIVLVIVLAIGGGLTYLVASSNDNEPETTQTTSKQPTAEDFGTDLQLREGDSVNISTGKYVDYTANVIAQTQGTKLLFFHAPWCPQCRDLESDIKNNNVPDGVTIIKVDYDTNQALRQKYGVTIQTTVVRVSDSGELQEKYVAYDEPTLAAVVKNLL